ncbi:MAG: beta-ketoacyl synthase N-terminal-like domain-containing protein [Methylobacter sp.]
MFEPLYIASFGASSSIGRDMLASAAAVRSGISGFMQHPYMIDTVGEPMRAAIVPWLDIELQGLERLQALLYPAIDQVLASITENKSKPLRLGLAVALPGQRPGLSPDLPTKLFHALGKQYPDIFTGIATFPNGHAAGFLALDAAIKKIDQNALDACIVAGVDSYIEPETLEWLEECDQLHGAGPLNNAWGFIPGEAAGAFLLIKESHIHRSVQQPLAKLLGLGVSFELKRIKTETVCIGEGLTQAFRAALEILPQGIKVTDVYCDMNGEPYRADEYGFSCLRTKEYFESASDFVAPADCWGDISSASGPLHIGLAAIAGKKNYAKGRYAFAWASSEGGERAAAVMEMMWSS